MPGVCRRRRARFLACVALACAASLFGVDRASGEALAWSDLPGILVASEAVPVRLSAAALLVSRQEAGPIPVALAVAPVDSERRVDVLVEVGVDETTAELEVFVYAFSADHATVATRSHLVRVGGPGVAGLKLVTRLESPAAIGYVRALVHPVGSDGFGLVAARPARPGGTSFRILEPMSRWTLALAPELAGGPPAAESVFVPYRRGAVVLVPAANPMLRVGERRFGVWDEPSQEARRLHFEPLVGGSMRSAPAAALPDGLFEFEVPALAAGRWASWWAVEGDDHVPAGDLPTILALDAGTTAEMWPEVSPADSEEPAGWQTRITSALTQEERRALTERREFLAAYREVLELLVDGQKAAARSRLQDFEVGVGSQGASGYVTLTRLEWHSVRTLLDDDFTHALPIALLHASQAAVYMDRQHHQLAGHSLKMAGRIATARARSSRTPEEARQAADLLLDLAGLIRGRPLVREELYDSALDVAPDHGRAWLRRGANFERRGLYREAIGDFERALELDPMLWEARLRLAVCMARRDKGAAAAEPMFRELLEEESVPSWVGAVAAQELARLQMAGGRAELAGETARQGLARWPGDQQLRVLAAWAAYESGSVAATRSAVAAAATPRPELGPTARTRYNMFPRQDYLSDLERLGNEAGGSLEALAARLTGTDA